MIREHATQQVETIALDANAVEAAERMQRAAVGSLVVVDDAGLAVGLVTDRDLVVGALTRDCDPATVGLAELVGDELVSAEPHESLDAVVERMQRHGVRRVPVLREGKPVGLVALDDLLDAIVEELGDLARGARGRFLSARRHAAVDRAREGAEEIFDELVGRLSRARWEARETFLARLDELREHLPGR